jgi:hypothetical protein
MSKPIICLIIALVFSSLNIIVLAKDGGACKLAEESVLVQIKKNSGNKLVLSTLTNKINTQANASERLFSIPVSQAPKNINKNDYLIAKIKHSIEGACAPEQVIGIEKFTIGNLRLQADEAFFYGGAFRLNEVQACLSKHEPACDAIKLPTYSKADIKKIQNIKVSTLKHCSLKAIQIHFTALKHISTSHYIIGCAISTLDEQEVPFYFDIVNNRLEYRGGLF